MLLPILPTASMPIFPSAVFPTPVVYPLLPTTVFHFIVPFRRFIFFLPILAALRAKVVEANTAEPAPLAIFLVGSLAKRVVIALPSPLVVPAAICAPLEKSAAVRAIRCDLCTPRLVLPRVLRD